MCSRVFLFMLAYIDFSVFLQHTVLERMSFLLEYLSDEERTSIEQRMKKICEGFQATITAIPEVDENGTTNGHVKTHKKLRELKMAQPRRSPRKIKPVQSYSPVRSIQKTPNKLENAEKTQNGRLKRKVVIPATPDETVIKKSKSEPALLDKEVVAETPAEQTRKRCKFLHSLCNSMWFCIFILFHVLLSRFYDFYHIIRFSTRSRQ